ncbi:unnamed protein product [Fusarium langsethiae]|nr:unnamed protein product [Fusarium langsethiae]
MGVSLLRSNKLDATEAAQFWNAAKATWAFQTVRLFPVQEKITRMGSPILRAVSSMARCSKNLDRFIESELMVKNYSFSSTVQFHCVDDSALDWNQSNYRATRNRVISRIVRVF